ncbi:S8 family serine peptidase [Candidatus Bipolaricaulota bacterium]|nr:S8 family serine peptidase [Candidatus Bipolaricaulota bacterium]
MKHQAVFISVCAVVLLACFQTLALPPDEHLARLDPALRVLVIEQGQADTPLSIHTLLGGESHYEITLPLGPEQDRIGVLVKLDRAFFGPRWLGLPVEWSTGSILGLSVSITELLTLIADDDVVYVEPAWKTEPTLDRSIPAVRADVVHSAVPPQLGEGVIVATVDTGIDYSHLDFRFDSDGDGFEESSRILAILDQTWGLFGVEYTRQQIESDLAQGFGPGQGQVHQSDTDGHGTHVMSIAAGDGSSSSDGFVGVAPEAWLIAVKTSFFTSDIIQAVRYVFDLADSLGLPAVVNLSLGGHEGPHDGTSLFEQGLDQLAAGPGHIIVVSAGNEGDQAIHASGTLLGGSSTFVVDPHDWEIELSLWYPGSSRFTITVSPPTDLPVIVPYGFDSGFAYTTDGTVRIDNASAGRNPNNNDNEAFIHLSNLTAGDWTVTVSDEGGGGRFDAWIIDGDGMIAGGDSTSTIDEPGNANEVVTVGSFNSKATWPSVSGQQDYSLEYPVGGLSSFSSRGPTRDGRTKPDVCAPGAWICAALSSDGLWQGFLAHPDGVHTMEVGTSMAAPHVAGAVTLMLSRDPGLTSGEVQQILRSTARRDAFTGSVPSQRWGWGKLDVAAALEEVDVTEPPIEPPPDTARPEVGLTSNPVSGEARFTYTTPEGTTVAWLKVYTYSGVLVHETMVDEEAGEYIWALQTNAGDPLASGLYLYVLVTDRGTSEVGRLVIAR